MTEKDTHEKMIEAFQEYFKWNDRFEYKKSDDAGKKARVCLSEIKKLASLRRKEIMDTREFRRQARGGKMGRPSKTIINENY